MWGADQMQDLSYHNVTPETTIKKSIIHSSKQIVQSVIKKKMEVYSFKEILDPVLNN